MEVDQDSSSSEDEAQFGYQLAPHAPGGAGAAAGALVPCKFDCNSNFPSDFEVREVDAGDGVLVAASTATFWGKPSERTEAQKRELCAKMRAHVKPSHGCISLCL